MKKFANVLCAVFMLLSLSVFSACGGGHVHEYGEWQVTKEPTCTEKGEEKRECLNCDEDETREIPALGHDWSEELYYKVKDGKLYSYRKCNRCGDTDDEKEVSGAKIATPSTLTQLLGEAAENDAVYLGEGDYTQDIEISKKGMKLVGAGAGKITAPIKVTADDVSLVQLTVTHTYEPRTVGETVANEVYKIDVSGKNFSMQGCNVSRTDGVAPPYGFLVRLTATEGTATFKDCVFVAPLAGDANTIHAASPSVIGGTGISLTMEDCTVKTNGYAIFNRFATAVYRNVTFDGIDDVKDLPANVTVKTLYMALNNANVEDVTFENCTIRNARSWGMLVAGKKLTVKGCTFEKCLSRMIGFSYGEIGECSVTDNVFDLSASGYGIKFDEDSLAEGAKVTITGNTFRGGDTANKEDGYCISNATTVPVTATGNKFENCKKQTVGSVTLN